VTKSFRAVESSSEYSGIASVRDASQPFALYSARLGWMLYFCAHRAICSRPYVFHHRVPVDVIALLTTELAEEALRALVEYFAARAALRPRCRARAVAGEGMRARAPEPLTGLRPGARAGARDHRASHPILAPSAAHDRERHRQSSLAFTRTVMRLDVHGDVQVAGLAALCRRALFRNADAVRRRRGRAAR